MTDDAIAHVSLQRAYQAAVQTLDEMRSSGEEISRDLDEGVIKQLLTESFAFQFEDDQTLLERRVNEILEQKVDGKRTGGGTA